MYDFNFWFYTFSAIPQTLAAILGFFAVFVVYKQTRVHELIDSKKEDVRYFLLILHSDKEIHEIEKLDEDAFYNLLQSGIEKLDPNKNKLGLNNGLYERLRDLMQEIITSWRRHYSADESRIYNFLTERRIALNKLIHAKKEIYSYFNKVIILGFTSIIFPLMLLPFGETLRLGLSWCLIYFGLLLAFVFVGYSIYSTYKITKL